jgi:hypothetical protein
MAKKKQFAGKKTKLAKLPLTQALASQLDGGEISPAPLTSAPTPFRPRPLTWDEVNAGQGEPLGATFLFLVRELTDLTHKLQSNPDTAQINHRFSLPKRVPGHRRMAHALREALESLRDLQGLLSRP